MTAETGTFTPTDEDGFCPECDVSMDLHDGDDSCDTAGRKADAVEGFFCVSGTWR